MRRRHFMMFGAGLLGLGIGRRAEAGRRLFGRCRRRPTVYYTYEPDPEPDPVHQCSITCWCDDEGETEVWGSGEDEDKAKACQMAKEHAEEQCGQHGLKRCDDPLSTLVEIPPGESLYLAKLIFKSGQGKPVMIAVSRRFKQSALEAARGIALGRSKSLGGIAEGSYKEFPVVRLQ